MAKKLNIIMVIALIILLLSGCAAQAISEFYCLPMRSEQYANLQSVMKDAMYGMEYSAPLSGENQQSVQAVDLDGDGLQEYLLFAKDSTDKPLHIFVFTGDGEYFHLLDTIVSSGSAFDKVEYVQMDDQPGYEIVIGRQVSEQVVRTVSVYSLKHGQMEQVLSDDYSQFITCDLNADTQKELFVLRPGETGKGVTVLYSMNGRTLERSQEVEMSEPADNIKRIMVSRLQDRSRAIYVASSVSGSDGIITDVFVWNQGLLQNISLSVDSGTSVQTLRNYYVYADDVDNDGVLELPSLITMKIEGDTGGASSQYVIRWFSMTSAGAVVDKMYTYHNFAGGWYIELDADIAARFTVSQKGSSYEFALWNETFTQTEKLMSLYVLTGQKREAQAVAGNRFVLHRTESTIYAASLEVASSAHGMTKESVVKAFNLIQADWKTGET